MSESPAKPTLSWHPFTPKGAAGAAAAPRWQLWLVLGATAALAVGTLLSFLAQRWAPVIVEAIDHLDDGGVIRRGVFHPGGAATDATLASNRHLAVALRWNPEAPRDQASDVGIYLEIDRALVCSLFGCLPVSYQRFGDIPVGRTETGAWWRAWSPILYAAVGFAFALYLIVSWWVLVVMHAWVVRLLAFYLDRQVDFPGAARVAQAALVPGAWWLIAAMFFYGREWLDVPGLLIVFVMHLPVGWLYTGLACRHLPPRPDVPPANPFQRGETEAPATPEAAPNPFRGPGG